MTDTLTLRNNLMTRITRAHQLKLQGEKPEETCEHDYHRFKETIKNTNAEFRGNAHFVVLACLKCKDKRRIDYVVEL